MSHLLILLRLDYLQFFDNITLLSTLFYFLLVHMQKSQQKLYEQMKLFGYKIKI